MNIRASMIPSYPDCCRRSAAKSWRKKFTALGYELRELPPSVGAAAGTAVHLSTAEMDRALWRGETANIDQAVELAITKFSKEIETGCIWDETTPNHNVAQIQIRRMTMAYVPRMPFTMADGQPAVEIGGEMGLRANAGDGWFVTGHPDLIDESRFVRDKKTGALVRPYHGQLGAYSLLVRSNGVCIPAGVGMDYIPRTARTKDQKPMLVTEYPVAACERCAMGVIKKIKADMKLFDESGDLEAFSANQMSMMCTSKYCPAFGTDFCELTK
jgi:hypothetical protein